MFNSCKKWIDPSLNNDPNNPMTVTLATLLSGTQVGLGYTYGGDMGYAALMWTQQLAGGANQPFAYDQYNFKPGDIDNVWNAEMYGGPMKDINILIGKAAADASPAYKGIAEIEMALAIGAITDLFGNAPYSQAFKGAANLSPAYDHQKAIYASIIILLEQAKTDLAANSAFYPGTDDFIYGGDLAKWTMLANALEARFYIHQTIVDPTHAYANALTALANGFTGNADDYKITFGTSEGNSNPFYQFNEQRGGDIGTGAFLLDTMVKISDPRLPVYYNADGGAYKGLPAGVGGADFTPVGSAFTSANSPVVFMSYVEQKFIEAEAKLQTDDASGAATAYNDAIKASLTANGVTDAEWVNTYANENSETISLEKIICQKYIALFLQFEVYNDYRRTGFPVLKLASGISPSISTIPYRYPYAQSEINYNSNCPSNINIFSNKVPWMDASLWNAK